MDMVQVSEISKPLDIGYKRTCNCPPNHINCLTPKEWIKSQVGIWEFSYEKRDIRDKSVHPAVFPIGLPAKCIKLFTHEGELVIDPFVGIGTTLLAAQDLNRNAVGFDLQKEYIDVAKSRLAQGNLLNNTQQIAVRDDARNIPKYLKEETVALAITSPPYSKFLDKPRLNKSMRGDLRNNKHFLTVQQYSQDPNDIGTLEPIAFSKALGEIYRGILPLLKPKAHCVIDINDLWWENKRIPTHVYVVEALIEAGYELRNILIWDRRNLVNRVGIFGWPSNYIKLGTTFEYILDFWRPPE
jgi:DNA modification methylase